MKKLKFLYKNKLWLASLGLTTTGSLVLAACGNNMQPNQSKTDDKKADKPETNKPDTIDPSKKDQPETDAKKEGQKPQVPTATTQQVAAVNSLLSNSEIQTYLSSIVNDSLKQIKADLDVVTKIGDFNQSKIMQSIYALDKTKNSSAATGTTDVKELVAKLKADAATADSGVSSEETNNFNTALAAVTDGATALLTALEALPKAQATNQLTTLKNAFTTALDNYKSANSTDAQTKLSALVTAKNDYQTKLSAVNSLLLTAERKAFALDRATSELDKYINTKVAAFLTTSAKKADHTTNLNNLVAKVRNDVLGLPGKDLWFEDDAPGSIATSDDRKNSTKLYAIVASLAHQIAAWNNLNNTLKIFTCNQGLLSKSTSALNLLGLHIDVKVPLDVARLNAYLVTDDANIEKLLANGGDNSVTKILEKVSVGIKHYESVLTKTSTETTATAKLVKDLTDLENSLTSDQTKKNKVTALKTATTTLITNFGKFQTQWKKLESFLFTDEAKTKVYPLLQNAKSLNQAIAVSDSYGQVLEVIGQAKKLEAVVDAINNNLTTSTTKGSSDTVASTLKTLITDIKNQSAGFGKALKEFVEVTNWPETAVTGQTGSDATTKIKGLAESIAKKTTSGATTYSGYIYTDGIAKSTATGAKLSLEDLQTKLAKLTLKDSSSADQTLGKIKNLLLQQLTPNYENQTAALNQHLPEMFNNGDVLPETQTHF
ncbi:hypothetical protein J2Z62_000442 [Mycoplasmoides fastidiosum]|uniref:Lipoprotein n=1 Tax=Mycoplasmoides fastidiosum TaxID=92758 RepID=A0ABU0LZ97_9BACT|nr:hypothetical protein [Mycoplasmoides fastidiosum]MDQ0514004.1 hypothetical protein [Mycoplasmoides fastidiosum]UUD37583.1 hypothetical protein NPA10_03380 [Mycoplasmoides fastidiosum]